MRTILLFLILAMVALCNGISQETKIDSLKTELSQNSSAEEKVALYRGIELEFYHRQIYYDSAFFYVKKAYELARKNDLVLEQAQTLFDQGMIYAALEEWETAIGYYERSIKFSKKGNYKSVLSAAYRNIGTIYLEKKNYTLAREYYLKAIAIGKEINDARLVASGQLKLGQVSYLEKEYERSKLIIESSQHIFDSLGYTPPQAYTYLAKTLYSLGDFNEAANQALTGFELSEKEGDLKSSYENALTLSKVFASKKDFENANDFTNKAMVYKDSIFSSKKLNEVEKLELRYKLNEREKELAALEEKNTYLNTIYILGALGILLLIVLVFRQLKIAKMTQEIHNTQTRLIKSELDLRDKKGPSSFDAAVAGDKEIKDTLI